MAIRMHSVGLDVKLILSNAFRMKVVSLVSIVLFA